ncbi:unnamed protein product [Cercopithifilaria johnstoni]|uniref:Uncharacterized protein n=1 Tax=Cercopithifilaria johnstoni TaxID=2874296 RepID=A0A8J2PZM2_9BILA|nr:unnamed protein product [Cercopithifilaria johnstoni]
MDPTSLGFVAVIAVLITVISIIVFKMYPNETDFEKAYGENALRLLTEDRANKTKNAKKNKGKNGEKKKDFGAEEKQNRGEKPTNGNLLYVRSSTNGAKEMNGTDGDEADATPNRKKPKSKQLMDESAKDEKVSVAKSMGDLSGQQNIAEKINELVSTANVLHDENKRTDIGERKAKKKNRARRNGEHLRQIVKAEVKMAEEIVPAVEVLPLESEEKNLQKKGNPLKDINANKFQTRLNAIAELEPEYVTFFTNYINNVNTQRAKLNDEIALMRKQVADKDRLVLQCTNKLTAAEQKDSEIAMLQKTLTEEKRKYKLFEQTVCTQLSNNTQEKSYLQRKYDQLQREFAALREEMKKAQSLIHSTPPPVDTKPYQQQIDRLKAELNSSKNRCSQQELELNQRLQAMQQIRKELQNQDCQIEHLSKTNALLEKRLQDVEGNTKAEHNTLEMKLQNTMKVAEELSAVTSEIRDEMLQHKGNAEIAVQEREKVDFIILPLAMSGEVGVPPVLRKVLVKIEASLSNDNLKEYLLTFSSHFQHCEQIHILNAQLMDANRERIRYLNDCAIYSKKLTEMETANAELNNQLEALQKANATSDANCNELTKEVEKYRKQLIDVMEAQYKEIAKLKNEMECIQKEKEKISKEAIEVAKCREELNKFKSEYNEKLNRMVSLEEEIAKYKKIEMERETVVSYDDTGAHEKMMMHGVQSSSKSDAVIYGDNVKLEINELKKRNEELRAANYKVVEISQQQEVIFKKHVEELEKDHEKARQQYCCNVSKALCAIAPSNTKLPNLPVIYNMDQFYKWLKDVENVVQKSRNIEKFNENENDGSENKINLAKVAELKASNRRYRAALASLSSHIDAIEQEAISMEKVYLGEISRLRHDINEQLKMQLENERKRKLELISEASKLFEVINGAQRHDNGRAELRMKNRSAYDLGGDNYG